jgi:hypothetical protein
MDRLVSDGEPILLLPPLPGSFVTGAASRLRQALAKALLHRRGQEGRFAGGLGNGAHRGEPAGRTGGQPAAHGIPTDAEQVGHRTSGARLLGLAELEGLQASVFLGIVLGAAERFQVLWRFMDRREGRFHGTRLRSACMSSWYRP